ncbi:hypothetical protein V5799_033052 [Amblyomma americanum]|uniref:Uncharacterized protein n=1 Tax=Amblyomma americanum TaxID=6943 RepID=A0AAQ4DPE6_AMBAM
MVFPSPEHLRLRLPTFLLPTLLLPALLLPALLLPTLRLTPLILPALLLKALRPSMPQLPTLLPWTLRLRTSPLLQRLLPAFLLKTPILLSPQHHPTQPCFQEVPVALFLLPAHQLEALTLQTLELSTPKAPFLGTTKLVFSIPDIPSLGIVLSSVPTFRIATLVALQPPLLEEKLPEPTLHPFQPQSTMSRLRTTTTSERNARTP